MEKARELGEPITRCVVGDFAENRLAEWVKLAPKHALELVFQRSCGKGSNSADIALTIHAMDLLARNTFARFLIVSSDSDFAPLALRLGRSGATVFGMGEAKSQSAWKTACTAFFDLPGKSAANPKDHGNSKQVAASPQQPAGKPTSADLDREAVRAILRRATEAAASGLPLSQLGQLIRHNSTQLSARVCGKGKLGKLLKGDPLVEILGKGSAMTVRLRERPCAKSPPAKARMPALADGSIA